LQAVQNHSAVMQKAHFKPDTSAMRRQIDPVSRDCLSCHDGSIAKLSAVSVGSWTHTTNLRGYNAGIHPIGIDYEESRRRHGGLKAVFAIDKRIKLVEGKVSCASCHDPYSDRKGRLVMDNRGSRLCLGCHLK
jgi:predicted CXXCH cytochrome family protein